MPSSNLLGPDGKPVNPPQEPQVPPLPESIQNFIHLEILRRFEDLREWNRAEIRDIEREATKKWKLLTVVAFLLTSVFGAYSYNFWKSIPKVAREQFIEPQVTDSVTKILESKSSQYIDDKIAPLETRIKHASSQIEQVEKDIAKKQGQLADEQNALRSRLHIQELATAAKAGDLSAYEEVSAKAATPGPLHDSAVAAIHEVEFFYDFDAGQIFTKTWAESGQDPGWSIEELLVYLRRIPDAQSRIGITNSLADLVRTNGPNQKGVVEELHQILEEEKNLMVRARVIRAIDAVAKQGFRPLDKMAVDSWWKLHSSDPAYLSPYGGYFRALGLLAEAKPRSAVTALDETLKLDPDAIHTRCLKAALLLDFGDVSEAETELKEVQARRPDFRWLKYYKALVELRRGNTDEAIKWLNAALERSPSLVEQAKLSPLKNLLESSGVHLPSKKSD